MLVLGAAVASSAHAQSELPIEDDELVGIAPAAVLSAEQARRLLDAAPPPALRGADLLEFLQRQIEAASTLGAAERRLQLVRRAAEVAPGSPQHWSALTRLIAAERGAGNFAAADTLRRQLLANPIAPPLGKAFLLFDAARWHARALDAVAARRDYAAAQELMREQLATSLPAIARQRLLAEDAWTQGRILEAEGRSDDAIAHYRQALTIYAGTKPANGAAARANGAGRAGATSPAGAAAATLPADRVATAQSLRHGLTQVQMLLTAALAKAGHLAQAELQAREYLAALEQGTPTPQQRAHAEMNLAWVWLLQGQPERAVARYERLLRETRLVSAGTKSVLALALQSQYASALAAQQRFSDAAALFQTLDALAAGDAAAQEVVGNRLPRALAYLKTGRTAPALALLDRAVDAMTERVGRDNLRTAEARGLRALAWQQSGRRADALAELQAVTTILANNAERVDFEERALSQQRRQIIVEALLAALAQEHARITDPAERARRAEVGLRGAEYLRLSRTQDAISAGAERASAGSPQLAALVRQSQDARQELDALYAALLRQLDGAPAADADAAALRRRVALLEQQRNALHQRLRTEHPAYWQLAYPRSARVADLARALAPDEVFIAIQPVGTATLVWAVTPQGRIEMAASPLGADEVAALVKSLRKAMDASIVTLEGFAPFDVDAAYRLYETLLAPLADVWRPAPQLVVSAGGALGHLPFALLVAAPDPLPLSANSPNAAPAPALRYAQYRNVAWLARTHAVTHVPSGAALISLRAVKSPAASRAFFGVGDPQFGTAASAPATTRALRRAGVTRSAATADTDPRVPPALPALLRTYASLPALPETRDEIIAIGAALGADLKRDALFGAAATRAQVRAADLADRRVVAFATHGLLPGDLPLLEEPALALSAGAADDSPLLTLADILTLKLNADWVVLSACNTASADGRGGDAISGLGRGFFYAGARALLVTHWEVETESARDLVTGTFMRYAHTKVERAQALRAAQLALIERGQDRSGRVSYAHPLFWAGYAVVGDGGR